jgi:hypothetical protein
MLICKNGFVKTHLNAWVNINKIPAFTIESKGGEWSVFAILTEKGDGIIVQSFDTREEAELSLNNMIDEQLEGWVYNG